MFESIIGNAPIKAYLQRALEQKKLPQTLLFSGPDGVGKALFAKEIASYLLGANERVTQEIHPDLHILRPEGKSGQHPIEGLRTLIDQVHSAPFEAKAKVFILHDAERMLPTSSNALLKILEEPNLDTTLILLTSRKSELIPTLLSRCIELSFQPLSVAEIEQVLEQKGLSLESSKLAHGSIGRAYELATDSDIHELRRVLFSLLETQNLTYVSLSQEIETIESLIAKEEDPTKLHKRTDHLFSEILHWFRDQTLLEMNADSSHLFYPQMKRVRQKLPPLAKVEEAIFQARFAYQRNIKVSALLERIFFSLHLINS